MTDCCIGEVAGQMVIGEQAAVHCWLMVRVNGQREQVAYIARIQQHDSWIQIKVKTVQLIFTQEV